MKTFFQPSVLQKRKQPEATWGEVWIVGRVELNLNLLLINILSYSLCLVGLGIVVVNQDGLGASH